MLSDTPRIAHAKVLDKQLAALGLNLAQLSELQEKHALELEALRTKQTKEWDALIPSDNLFTAATADNKRACTHEGSYFCQDCPGCEWDEVDEII